MDTPDDASHAKLTHALARMVACREQADDRRKQLRHHATERLDGHAHAIGVASDALKDPEKRNALVYRYLRAQLTEAARLRAIEGRGDAESG